MLYKEREKIIREIAFEQEKKNPGLKFNPGLALIDLRTTKLGPELICLLPSRFLVSSRNASPQRCVTTIKTAV